MSSEKDALFGQLAVEGGHLTAEQLADAQTVQRVGAGGEDLRKVLVSMGLITEKAAGKLDRELKSRRRDARAARKAGSRAKRERRIHAREGKPVPAEKAEARARREHARRERARTEPKRRPAGAPHRQSATSGEDEARLYRRKLLAGIGGGAAAAAILGAIVLVSVMLAGGEEKERESRPPPEMYGAERLDPDYEVARAVQMANELRAKRYLDYAKRHALDHPDEYEKTLVLFKRAMFHASRTSLEEETAEETQAHRARWKQDAIDALDAVREKADELARGGDFDGGFAVLSGLAIELRKQVPNELMGANAELTTGGRERIRAILDEAERAAGAGRKRDATSKLRALDRIRFRHAMSEVAPRREALLRRIADME